MQFQHLLESPDELWDNLIMLARARKAIVMNANDARVTGRGTVGTIIQEVSFTCFTSIHPFLPTSLTNDAP